MSDDSPEASSSEPDSESFDKLNFLVNMPPLDPSWLSKFDQSPFLPLLTYMPWFPKLDQSPFLPKLSDMPWFPKLDLSPLFPKLSDAPWFPKLDLSPFFSAQLDMSGLLPKLDLSPLLGKQLVTPWLPTLDMSALVSSVDVSLLFPQIDASSFLPMIDLPSLMNRIDASALSVIADQDFGYGVDAESRPVPSSRKPSRQTLSDREVAAMLTVFVFLIVCIGLSLAVQDYPTIATLSRVTGANPFEVAMGCGALTFWASYSRSSRD